MIFFLICALVPPVIATGIYEKLTKKDLTVKRWLYCYCVFTCLINLLSWGLLVGLRDYHSLAPYATGILCFYMAFSLIGAVVFPVVGLFFSKNVEITVDDDHEKQD